MTEERKRKRRVRSFRRIRVNMLVVGGSVLLLGMALMVSTVLVAKNEKLRHLAIFYLIFGGLILIVRSALSAIDRYRKRKYKKR